jgi:hypothetical protein
MRLASIYQTDHEEPLYLEYTLLDATGEPVVPADVQQPTSDVADAAIDLSEPVEMGQEIRESVVVPAGTSDAYGWIEDEQER